MEIQYAMLCQKVARNEMKQLSCTPISNLMRDDESIVDYPLWVTFLYGIKGKQYTFQVEVENPVGQTEVQYQFPFTYSDKSTHDGELFDIRFEPSQDGIYILHLLLYGKRLRDIHLPISIKAE